jgi:SAM-dependent methyltransferase
MLVCPVCKSKLDIEVEKIEKGEVEEGYLQCTSCNRRYSIINYIPRFVETDAYVSSFSNEWSKFGKVQLDSFNGRNESENTFKERTGINLNEIKDKLVLDVGCGAGRFTEIASKYGGDVIGIDLSYSVDVALENLGVKTGINFIQADIFNLPFKEGFFDIIFSIGVLHHTPNTRKAFLSCIPYLGNGAEIAIWVYTDEGVDDRIKPLRDVYRTTYNHISDFYRIFTTRMGQKQLLKISQIMAYGLYYPAKIPVAGKILDLVIPLSDHPDPTWRVLDTFDWYSPKYQWKHTYKEVEDWFKEAGLMHIEKLRIPVSVRGQKLDVTSFDDGTKLEF